MSEYDGLPAAVRREAEEADRALAAVHEAAGNEPVATGAGNRQQGIPDGEIPAGERTSGQASYEAPVAGGDKAPAAGDNDASWKTRFKVLQGKYSSEVPVLAEQVRNLRAQNTELLDEVAALREMQAEVAQRMPQQLTPHDVAEYGDEMMRMVAQQNSVAAQNEELKRRLDRQEQMQAEQQAAQSSRAFVSHLDELFPQWRAVNEDVEFDDWLLATGRKDSFVRSAAQGDAEYVVTIMQMYLNTADRRTADNAREDNGHASQAAGTDNHFTRRIAQQVSPSTTSTAAPAADMPNGRVWRMNEVNSFYDQLARGRFPFNMGDVVVGSYEDATRIDADITRAGAENRIVG